MNSIATTSPSQTPAIRDFYPLGQQQNAAPPDDAHRLRHARLAVHSRLCLHRRARRPAPHRRQIVAGNRIQLVPLNQFSWWNKYQFTPVWSGALAGLSTSPTFRLIDDSVKLPGFVRFDAAVYAKIKRDVGERRSISRTSSTKAIGPLLMVQQPVAGPAANGQADSHREILKRECDRGGLPDCDSLPLLRLTNIRVAGSHVCVFSSAWMRYF